MTNGVFGTEIDTKTLERTPEYRVMIIRYKAQLAHNKLMTAEGRDTDCRKYVDDLKKEYGYGVKTLGTIYNATGGDLTFVEAHDWYGNIFNKGQYPRKIKNGQWGGFLHVHPAEDHGSIAAVVYRGENGNGVAMKWILCWSNLYIGASKVYTMIRKEEFFNNGYGWDALKKKVDGGSTESEDKCDGCKSEATIDKQPDASFKAILSLTD